MWPRLWKHQIKLNRAKIVVINLEIQKKSFRSRTHKTMCSQVSTTSRQGKVPRSRVWESIGHMYITRLDDTSEIGLYYSINWRVGSHIVITKKWDTWGTTQHRIHQCRQLNKQSIHVWTQQTNVRFRTQTRFQEVPWKWSIPIFPFSLIFENIKVK